ncbi:MAG: diacylglycerol/lipid kinase family protein, partial [Planctomycetota bacterium]
MASAQTIDRTHERRLPVESSVLLANPCARGVGRAAIARIVARLRLEGRAVLEIGRDGSARSLARQAVQCRTRCVLVAGGDGTLHDVIQEVAGTRTALGIIPAGTANDLAARLALPADLEAACAALASPWVAAIDLLRIGDRRVATVGGFGLPAHVAHACNELRARAFTGRAFAPLGRSIYSVTAAARIIARGAMPMTYSLRANHGHPQTMVASALLVGLVSKFGGDLKLVPDGSIRPGTFFALAITAKTRSSLLTTLTRLRAGRTDRLRARAFTDLTSLSI